MNDTVYLSRYSGPRPTGPAKRESLPRMNDPNYLDTMGRKTRKSNNTSHGSSSNNSSRLKDKANTRQHSTPKKDLNSSNSEDSDKLYPNLADFYNTEVDESLTTTETSTDRSFSDTQTYNSSSRSEIRDQSSTSEKCLHLKDSLDRFEKLPPYKHKNIPKRNDTSGRNFMSEWSLSSIGFSVGIVLILIVVSHACTSMFQSNETGISSNEFNLTSSIIKLRSLFPSQDKSIWGSFGSGIQEVQSEHHRPAIFLLLSAHDETTNCLAKKVAEIAQSALGGTGDVILTTDKLENDIGDVLNMMENLMQQTKAVVISDLLSLRPEAIRAFHDICDEYSPLDANSVYLFTISAERLEKSSNLQEFPETQFANRSSIDMIGGSGNLHEFAETQLTNRFSTAINHDTLKALVVRITSGAVLAIKEEKIIPCSE